MRVKAAVRTVPVRAGAAPKTPAGPRASATTTAALAPPRRPAPAGDRGQRRPPGHGHFSQGVAQLRGQGAVVVVRVLVVVHRPISAIMTGPSSPRRAVIARDR